MKPFTYHAPRGLDEAVALLDRHGPDARVIAGGQSLLLEMKARAATPPVLVAIGDLPGLRDVHYLPSGELEVGGATTYATLAAARLRGWHAEIATVAGNLADRPVRTMGTIGGALCQAEPRFDMPVLAVGVDAQVELASAGGTRTLAAAELADAGLRPGEILTAVRFPPAAEFSNVALEKFRRRVFEAALASVVCALQADDDGGIAHARIAVGAIAPAPVLAATAGQLAGRTLTPSQIREVGQAVTDEVLPPEAATTPSRRYQRELLPALVRRAVTRALSQGRN